MNVLWAPQWTVETVKELIVDHKATKRAESSQASTEVWGDNDEDDDDQATFLYDAGDVESTNPFADREEVRLSGTTEDIDLDGLPLALDQNGLQIHDQLLLEEKLRKNLERAHEQQEQEQDKVFSVHYSEERISKCAIPGMGAGIACAQGPRVKMEDTNIAQTIHFQAGGANYQANAFGVFDGHGSDKISKYVEQNLAIFLQATLEYYNKLAFTDRGIWKALRSAFKWLDRTCPEQDQPHGTTALVAFIFGEKVWIANAGDCRATTYRKDENGLIVCDTLIEDANCTNPRFVKTVVKLGGKIFKDRRETLRVQGILTITRSIGDCVHKGKTGQCCISAKPVITCIPKKTDTMLILGSDGLWSVGTSKRVAEAVKVIIETIGSTPDVISTALTSSALRNGSTDNVTVIVVKL